MKKQEVHGELSKLIDASPLRSELENNNQLVLGSLLLLYRKDERAERNLMNASIPSQCYSNIYVQII